MCAFTFAILHFARATYMSIPSTGLSREERSSKLPSLDIDSALTEVIEQVASVSFQQACILQDVGPTKGHELVDTGEWESYRDGSTRKVTLRSIKARRDRLLAEAKTTPREPLREGLREGPAASLAARAKRKGRPRKRPAGEAANEGAATAVRDGAQKARAGHQEEAATK
jgi:hypothetical protein